MLNREFRHLHHHLHQKRNQNPNDGNDDSVFSFSFDRSEKWESSPLAVAAADFPKVPLYLPQIAGEEENWKQNPKKRQKNIDLKKIFECPGFSERADRASG